MNVTYLLYGSSLSFVQIKAIRTYSILQSSSFKVMNQLINAEFQWKFYWSSIAAILTSNESRRINNPAINIKQLGMIKQLLLNVT